MSAPKIFKVKLKNYILIILLVFKCIEVGIDSSVSEPGYQCRGLKAKQKSALELISRAASSVGVMYRSHDPNTGSYPGGGEIPKKKAGRNT